MKTIITLLTVLLPLTAFAQEAVVFDLQDEELLNFPSEALMMQGKADEDDFLDLKDIAPFMNRLKGTVTECACSTNIASGLITLQKQSGVPNDVLLQQCEAKEGKLFGVQSGGELQGFGTALVCGLRVYQGGTFNPDPVKQKTNDPTSEYPNYDETRRKQQESQKRLNDYMNSPEYKREKQRINDSFRQQNERNRNATWPEQKKKHMPVGGEGHGK